MDRYRIWGLKNSEVAAGEGLYVVCCILKASQALNANRYRHRNIELIMKDGT